MSVLEFRDVHVVYQRRDGAPVRAVVRCKPHVEAGEIVGLVGETGCGKSSLARAAVGLVPRPPGKLIRRPTASLARATSTPARERRLQLVFQNPYDSLNPRRLVGAADRRRSSASTRAGYRARATSLRVAELLQPGGLPPAWPNATRIS